MTDTENMTNTDQQDEYITVPKGTTVNRERFERLSKKYEDSETRIKELEEQIKGLQATSEADKSAIEEFKAQVAIASEERAKAQADWEQQLATKDKEADLLKAGCIDTESALASFHDGMTIEQLRNAKPHLFASTTKPSGGNAKEPATPSDTLEDKLRKSFGLA